jgi:hypothetical protein
VVSGTRTEELPKEMQSMSAPQRKAYVVQKSQERAAIQKEIQDLNKKRQEYLSANTPQEQKDAMLDAAMIKAIKEKAKSKNLTWK